MMLTNLQKLTAQAIVNIFETGRVRGDYGKVTLLAGDPGHLTYGKSQTTLASGNLHLLVKSYCEAPRAARGQQLSRYLGRLAARDTALDDDRQLHSLLRDAGEDSVMRDVQDRFFDRVYWEPGVTVCTAMEIRTALGTAVVYDSHIHGSWKTVRRLTEEAYGTLMDCGEQEWINGYVKERRAWLAGHPKKVLHNTVYRMDSFQRLIDEDAWNLPLPVLVRGINIDKSALGEPGFARASAQDRSERTLLRLRPRMRGKDVVALQRALVSAGFATPIDGVFGAVTEARVRAFQRAHGLKSDGIVGPVTRSALGL
jgi:chitosanase